MIKRSLLTLAATLAMSLLSASAMAENAGLAFAGLRPNGYTEKAAIPAAPGAPVWVGDYTVVQVRPMNGESPNVLWKKTTNALGMNVFGPADGRDIGTTMWFGEMPSANGSDALVKKLSEIGAASARSSQTKLSAQNQPMSFFREEGASSLVSVSCVAQAPDCRQELHARDAANDSRRKEALHALANFLETGDVILDWALSREEIENGAWRAVHDGENAVKITRNHSLVFGEVDGEGLRVSVLTLKQLPLTQ